MTLRDKALAAVREEISRQIMAEAKIPTIETLVDVVGEVYLDAAIAVTDPDGFELMSGSAEEGMSVAHGLIKELKPNG